MTGRNVAIVTAGGREVGKAIERITRGIRPGEIELFGRGYEQDAAEAFSQPRSVIVFIGHGYAWDGGGWSLGGRDKAVFDWDDAPTSIDAHVLVFATCNAAGLAPDAASRMGSPGLVIHDNPARDEIYLVDMGHTAAAVIDHSRFLPEEPIGEDLARMWNSANREAQERVDHHLKRITDAHYRQWRTTSSG